MTRSERNQAKAGQARAKKAGERFFENRFTGEVTALNPNDAEGRQIAQQRTARNQQARRRNAEIKRERAIASGDQRSERSKKIIAELEKAQQKKSPAPAGSLTARGRQERIERLRTPAPAGSLTEAGREGAGGIRDSTLAGSVRVRSTIGDTEVSTLFKKKLDDFVSSQPAPTPTLSDTRTQRATTTVQTRSPPLQTERPALVASRIGGTIQAKDFGGRTQRQLFISEAPKNTEIGFIRLQQELENQAEKNFQRASKLRAKSESVFALKTGEALATAGSVAVSPFALGQSILLNPVGTFKGLFKSAASFFADPAKTFTDVGTSLKERPVQSATGIVTGVALSAASSVGATKLKGAATKPRVPKTSVARTITTIVESEGVGTPKLVKGRQISNVKFEVKSLFDKILRREGKQKTVVIKTNIEKGFSNPETTILRTRLKSPDTTGKFTNLGKQGFQISKVGDKFVSVQEDVLRVKKGKKTLQSRSKQVNVIVDRKATTGQDFKLSLGIQTEGSKFAKVKPKRRLFTPTEARTATQIPEPPVKVSSVTTSKSMQVLGITQPSKIVVRKTKIDFTGGKLGQFITVEGRASKEAFTREFAGTGKDLGIQTKKLLRVGKKGQFASSINKPVEQLESAVSRPTGKVSRPTGKVTRTITDRDIAATLKPSKSAQLEAARKSIELPSSKIKIRPSVLVAGGVLGAVSTARAIDTRVIPVSVQGQTPRVVQIPVQKVGGVIKTQQTPITAQIPITTTVPTTTTVPVTSVSTVLPPFVPPVLPPVLPPIALPPPVLFPTGNLRVRRRRGSQLAGQKRTFAPSLLGVRQRFSVGDTPTGAFTGLEARPFVEKKKKKKRKR